MDAILIISNAVEHIKMAKEELATTFSITDGGSLHYMIGIEFNFHGPDNSIQLYQRKCTEDILNKYQMMDLKPSPIPVAPHLSLSSDMAPKDPQEIKEMETQPFREMLGSLRYLVSCTGPNLFYITGYLSRFMQNPSKPHLDALLQVHHKSLYIYIPKVHFRDRQPIMYPNIMKILNILTTSTFM